MNENANLDVEKRLERAIELAKGALNFVQTRCKELSTQDEKDPYMLEQMTLAYAVAISNYSAYSEHAPDTPWGFFKENALYSLTVAFDHMEKEFINKKEE